MLTHMKSLPQFVTTCYNRRQIRDLSPHVTNPSKSPKIWAILEGVCSLSLGRGLQKTLLYMQHSQGKTTNVSYLYCLEQILWHRCLPNEAWAQARLLNTQIHSLFVQWVGIKDVCKCLQEYIPHLHQPILEKEMQSQDFLWNVTLIKYWTENVEMQHPAKIVCFLVPNY